MHRVTIPFRFDTYGPTEREMIADAVRALTVVSASERGEIQDLLQVYDEPWAIGSCDEILVKAHEVTLGTVDIGMRFLKKPRSAGDSIQRFYWEVDYGQPGVRSFLHIDLCLVSWEPHMGRMRLGQGVLRTAEDEYTYWGVD